MKQEKKSCKVISVYGSTSEQAKTGYAINLAVALNLVTKTRAVFISTKTTLDPERGIDLLDLEEIKRGHLQEIRDMYQYVIIDLPLDIDELTYEIFSCSDRIHFLVDSAKTHLEKGHGFLEGLLKKGLRDIHDRVEVVINRLNIFDRFSVEEISWLLRRDVWAVVPEPGIVDSPIDSKGIPLVLRSQEMPYSKAVIYIAKRTSGELLGLALGSGAAFGLAHIGVLRVLEQNQIAVDILSGSSIGALIASMWGLGFSSDKIERIAKKLKNKLNIMRLLDFTIPISGILAGQSMKGFLKGILGEKTFEDLQIPVKIMVYDLANRETLSIEKGLLVDAVYMSIAVPGIFKPCMKKGRVIIDGGVSEPVPVDILARHGVKKIIAVNVLPGPGDIQKKNMSLKKRMEEEENLMQSGSFYIRLRFRLRNFLRKVFTPNIFDVIMTTMQSMEYTLAEASCKKADVVLHPVFTEAASIDFHLVKGFIKRAEEETRLHLKEIKELVSR